MKSFEAEIETELLTLEGMTTLQEKEVSLHESIDEFYEQPLPDYLINDPELLGYPDAGFQQMIYSKVVAELIGCEDVIDLGCGRGDLYPVVNGFGIQYTGVDRLESMKKVAEQKYPGINFLCQDWGKPLPTSDAVVIIGQDTGSYSPSESIEWYAELLERSLTLATRKIVFVLPEIRENASGLWISDAIRLLPSNLPYKIDASFASGVYMLSIWINPFV